MVGMIIINKMRTFFLFFATILRRALCCFRRRRRLSYIEPLTDIGVIASNQNDDLENWNNWDSEGVGNKRPSSIQEHIEFYRQQKVQIQGETLDANEEHTDFFEDMIPQITTQKKILIGSNMKNHEMSNNLSLSPDSILMGNELGEWDESSGWEGEKLEWEALEALKEKKRLERERKAFEQQQRRIERSSKSLPVKVNA